MRIIVSNDDGVHAPGIRSLANEMALLGDVVVVAPDRNRSGASNSLTLARPIRVRTLDNGYHSVDGTPTDCVHLAITGFVEPKADIVVSGLNDGANLGDDIIYSGTVAAAMEGRNLGLPAVAFSMVGQEIQYYDTGAAIARTIVEELIKTGLPSQTILNVNIPDVALANIRGFMVTRLGSRHHAEPMIRQFDPRQEPIYWVGPPGAAADAGQGTDFDAVRNGYVSITPIHLDMTHYSMFEPLSQLIQKFKMP